MKSNQMLRHLKTEEELCKSQDLPVPWDNEVLSLGEASTLHGDALLSHSQWLGC